MSTLFPISTGALGTRDFDVNAFMAGEGFTVLLREKTSDVLLITLDETLTAPQLDALQSAVNKELLGFETTLAGAQAVRTTTLPITSVFADIPFNTVSPQINPLIVERDSVNTDNMLLKASGLYALCYRLDLVMPSQSNATALVTVRIRAKDTGIALPGSQAEATVFDDSSINGDQMNNKISDFVPYLSPGGLDFVTLQVKYTAVGGSPTVEGRANGVVFRAIPLFVS